MDKKEVTDDLLRAGSRQVRRLVPRGRRKSEGRAKVPMSRHSWDACCIPLFKAQFGEKGCPCLGVESRNLQKGAWQRQDRIIIAAMMRRERKERPSGSILHPHHAVPGHRRGHGEI